MFIYIKVLVILATLLISHSAFSCKCAQYDAEERFERADYAFIANLSFLDEAAAASNGAYHFDIVEVLKGDLGSTVQTVKLENPSKCDFGFYYFHGYEMPLLIFAEGEPPFRLTQCQGLVTSLSRFE